MARPKKLVVRMDDGTRVNARIVRAKHNRRTTVCLKCVPNNTYMKAIADIIQYGALGTDRHTVVWECQECKAQYAVSYAVDYDYEE